MVIYQGYPFVYIYEMFLNDRDNVSVVTTRATKFALGEFYHLYNRGTDKRTIFFDEPDYRRFIQLLYLCNSSVSVNMRNVHKDFSSPFDFDRGEPTVAIGAYCLMPNHFHILLTPLVENGVSTFMNKLGTGYSMYFNKRYTRTGSLFQGTFKSEHADSDEYLKYLYSYIHLNPVKLIDKDWKEKGIKDAAKSYDFAASFKYSSLQDYLQGVREEVVILKKDSFPEYFQTPGKVKEELLEWLTYDIT